MFGLSITHLIIILVIVMIIFGGGKLPDLGKQLGSAINEFKNSINPPQSEKPKEGEEDKKV